MIRLCLALLLATPALHAAELDADRQMANSLLAVSQSRMPEALAASKTKVNAAKSWLKVGLSKLSLMLYPQGAGRGSKDAEALKDSDPLRAKARVESYASTTTLYPERPDFALVTFEQGYQSSTLSDSTPKRQFWSRENGRWKIIHETSL